MSALSARLEIQSSLPSNRLAAIFDELITTGPLQGAPVRKASPRNDQPMWQITGGSSPRTIGIWRLKAGGLSFEAAPDVLDEALKGFGRDTGLFGLLRTRGKTKRVEADFHDFPRYCEIFRDAIIREDPQATVSMETPTY